MEHVQWADRGQQVQLGRSDSEAPALFAGASRLGCAQLTSPSFSIWVQIRGSAWVEAKEGKFRLRRGDWVALDRESRPTVQTDRDGLCVGLTLGADVLKALGQFADLGLYAGRGQLDLRESRVLLHLWHQATRRAEAGEGVAIQVLRPVLLHLAALQRDITARVAHCPGRSRSRKRQVFSRLQRARLFMEGNADRVVRIGELAELTSFSSWYFSKTFQAVYGESPQAAAARMRLERAADLLETTTMMIGEIAAASGFDNCCSFARAFRARYGMSASGYRTAASSTGSAKSPGAAGKAALRTGT
ncbi:AraC family transcriptional regulator [Lysobacter daejeonensis GH1-9]|uniref:AraC family transcriptional regulator n=1 Tax=Lysobacter daejeonensis GH1-9 TaxID=1385517 RepID=A0A0A0EXF8_9GAMM|nr:helix-turn-helix domain-containing protein [Lysobacter daejeonensis]KGM54773.1 AraC family transcriptional regulator [Lysobacter daejeonensis GH1-9]